jgi:hypothetical protein
VKVNALIVDAFIAWLNVAVAVVAMDMPVPPLAGVDAMTVGAVGGAEDAPEPEPPPPHPTITQAAVTSHQVLWNRISKFSLTPLLHEFASSTSRLGRDTNRNPRVLKSLHQSRILVRRQEHAVHMRPEHESDPSFESMPY